MPSKRRSLLSERVLSLVTNEWTPVEEFMERAIPLVPPGRALRQYQLAQERADRERSARERAGKKLIARKPVPPQSAQIEMGARGIINDIIGSGRDRKALEIKTGANRGERWVRLSHERQYAHHCCLHGGSCRGTGEEEAAEGDALATLIEKVLESRRSREAVAPYSNVRGVDPGEIDRLLREAG